MERRLYIFKDGNDANHLSIRDVTEGREEGRAMVRIEEEKGVRNIWEIGWNDIEIIGWVTDCK